MKMIVWEVIWGDIVFQVLYVCGRCFFLSLDEASALAKLLPSTCLILESDALPLSVVHSITGVAGNELAETPQLSVLHGHRADTQLHVRTLNCFKAIFMPYIYSWQRQLCCVEEHNVLMMYITLGKHAEAPWSESSSTQPTLSEKRLSREQQRGG